MTTQVGDDWLRSYAELALRIDRQLAASGGGSALIYGGPDAWQAAVAAEEPVPPARLAEECDILLRDIPVDGHRAACLAAQLTAMRATARQLDGAEVPFPEHARECLGVAVDWQPEDRFEAAHARLAAALPAGPGPLAERLYAWQRAHTVPADRLPELARCAIAETVARTRTLVDLPDGIDVDVRLDPGPHRGHYAGGNRGTIYVNDSLPFNGADLLYVVAHEGFPGHIAESLLKATHLADRPEHAIRFMISPPFVVSEGLGLHAQQLAFPGDEAQRWLTDQVFAPLGIPSDGSDFAAIHDARNVLWGAWGNAAHLAARGRPDAELAAYLTRWALLTEAETAWALGSLRAPAMGTYVLGYFHGWRLLQSWLDHPDRRLRVRQLLREPVLPSDLA
ncbi:hypothetical protein OG946_20070 [Streptomyces sp. NBC_01808]|uniref:hypothetical protein n=1 Tax=Streptomyces sp. NBC_01808 TaxID=2975947 RepID=UPI002DD8FA6D|nr:hypothetical protein [Streptomyces sp. NBC_01808]WSA39452.1 hypothetical protein OG946_20070 [Streptomyces sp. NBC_01808]